MYEAMTALLQGIARIASESDRQRAATLLDSIESRPPSTLIELRSVVFDETRSNDDRTAAVWLVHYLEEPSEVASAMMRLLQQPGVPSQVIFEATKIIGLRDYRPAIPLLIANLLGPEPSLQAISVQSLADMADESMVEPLLSSAQRQELPVAVRCQCVEALANLGDWNDVSIIVRAIGEIASEDDPDIRYACAYTLAELANPLCEPVLARLRKDQRATKWGSVEQEARRGLERLEEDR